MPSVNRKNAESAKLLWGINELGRKGWELVTVTDDSPGSVLGAKTYYFKRPL